MSGVSGQPPGDPLDELRAVDPVNEAELPPASLARIRARVREDIEDMQTARPDRRRPLRLAGIGAGGVVVAALAFMLAFDRGGPVPVGTPDPGGVEIGSASCVERYSPDTLRRRDHAFDGTVRSIDGERVTFTVNAAYKGVGGETVRLTAPGMAGDAITSAGGPSFRVGQRYLVAGDAEFAWACGFSRPYDTGSAEEWAAALRD